MMLREEVVEEEVVVAGPEPFVKRRFDPTPFVLGIMALVVVIGLALAWNALTRPADPSGGDGTQYDEYPDFREPARLGPEDAIGPKAV